MLWQKLVSAAAKPLGSVSPLSRWVFSAQGGARQELKICPELVKISFLYVYKKILYIVCSPNSKEKRPSTQFLENGSDESV